MTGPGDDAARRVASSAGVTSGRALAAALLAVSLLLGVMLGVTLDRSVLLRRRPPRASFATAGDRSGNRAAAMEAGRRRFRDRFATELSLTPDQSTRVDTIMRRTESRVQKLREATRPEMDSIVRESRTEIDSVLTPAQREKFHAMHMRPGRGGRFGASATAVGSPASGSPASGSPAPTSPSPSSTAPKTP